MKTVTPDIVDVLRTKYIAQRKAINMFTRLWGTTTVRGTEVFNLRKYYYKPSRYEEDTQKLAKFIGMSDSLEQDQEGIDSAWLWLNPANDTATDVTWETSYLVDNLNKAMLEYTYTPEDDPNDPNQVPYHSVQGTVVIMPKYYKGAPVGGGSVASDDPSPNIRYESPNFPVSDANQSLAIQYVIDHFHEYPENGYPVHTEENDPYKAAILLYALRSSEVHVTVLSVNKEYVGKPGTDSYLGQAIKVSVRIPFYTFTSSTDMVGVMVNDLTSYTGVDPADKTKASAVMEVPVQYVKTLLSRSSRWLEDDTEVESSNDPGTRKYNSASYGISDYWVTDGEDVYLKTSVVRDSALKSEEKVKLLYGLVDTDYKKKKVPAWKKLVSFVLVIVAVVASFYTGGAAGAAVGNGAWSAVVMGATVVTTATMYVSLMSAAFALGGAEQIGSSLAGFSKTLSPLSRVAGVILFVSAITNAIRENLAKEAASRAASNAAEQTTMAVAGDMLKSGSLAALEMTTGATNLSKMSFDHTTKLMGTVLNQYQKAEIRDHEKTIAKYQKELDSIREAEEQNQVRDIVKEFALHYPNVLSASASEYSELYDRPYEWWSTKYHTGCIQANSVSGLWQAPDTGATMSNS